MRHALAALFLATALLPAQINIAFHNGSTTVNAMTTRPDGTVVATSSNTWNNASRTMRYTVGDGTTSVTKTIQDSGKFSGTFTEGIHFATFGGFTGTTLTITGNPNSGDSRSAVNGLVIFPGNLPEPPEIASFTADDHYLRRRPRPLDHAVFFRTMLK